MTRVAMVLVLLVTQVVVFAQNEQDAGLVPLSEELQGRYATSVPKDFLIDPQGLLRGGEGRDRREFLRYHSSDSLIDLYVLIFKGEQMLFNSASLSDHLLEQRGNTKPAVMIHYFMGRPDRAQLHFSAELMGAVPQSEQDRALENAFKRAKNGVSPMDELEKFMVQTSIGIYRMERLLTAGTASPAPLVIAESENAGVQEREQERRIFIKTLKAQWSHHGLKVILGVLLLVSLWLLKCMHLRRASYTFPDGEARERLGASHAAGVGAIISFAKSSPPPAAQLERLNMH